MDSHSDPKARPQQVFDWPVGASQSRDDLIVSQANAAAVQLVDGWPKSWFGPCAVIVGPAGSGKSHLASIWRRMSEADGPRTGESLRDLAERAQEGRPILLEDVDRGYFQPAGEGPALEETGLFHLINSVRQSGATLLMTARARPARWPIALPDLASRLRAVQVAEIGLPDDLLLLAVTQKLFADRQIEVDPGVIDYLCRHIDRSLAAAANAVDRLDRASLSSRKAITTRLVRAELPEINAEQSQFDL